MALVAALLLTACGSSAATSQTSRTAPASVSPSPQPSASTLGRVAVADEAQYTTDAKKISPTLEGNSDTELLTYGYATCAYLDARGSSAQLKQLMTQDGLASLEEQIAVLGSAVKHLCPQHLDLGSDLSTSAVDPADLPDSELVDRLQKTIIPKLEAKWETYSPDEKAVLCDDIDESADDFASQLATGYPGLTEAELNSVKFAFGAALFTICVGD